MRRGLSAATIDRGALSRGQGAATDNDDEGDEMRTEYELWHWPTDGAAMAQRLGQYATLDDAMGAAGHVYPTEWRTTPSGALCLRHDLARELGYTTGQPWAISEMQVPETDAERIDLAVRLGVEYGQTDGDHHKTWVIDQMVRLLAGDRYEHIIAGYRDGEDGPDTYSWDEGIAP